MRKEKCTHGDFLSQGAVNDPPKNTQKRKNELLKFKVCAKIKYGSYKQIKNFERYSFAIFEPKKF